VIKKPLIIPFLITLIFSTFSPISITTSSAAQTACVIGSSAECPATSPQEIYNLYGTTADGTYYLKVNGTATQVYLLMNRTGSDNGAWVLMMKAAPGSTSFPYSSTYWTSSSTVLNENSLSNDLSTDAKFSVFNNLPVKKMLAVFKAGSASGAQPYVAGTYGIPIGGDIASNAFGGHVWLETLPTVQTAQTQMTTARTILGDAATSIRTTLFMKSSSDTPKYTNTGTSPINQVFSYEIISGRYGFVNTACGNATMNVRWGLNWNENLPVGDFSSCDDYGGIGSGTGYSAFDASPWPGYVGGGSYPAPGTANGHKNLSFQIWGKVADPSLGNVQSLATTVTGTTASLSWQAPSGVTATDYVVQYKTAAESSWPTANTLLVSGQTTASVTGLTAGTSYSFRVIARTATDSTASVSSITPVTITITTITNKLQLRGSTTASATVSSGSLSYSASGACTVNSSTGAVTFTSTGNCTITATAASSPNPTASTTFEIVSNLTQRIISRTGIQPNSLSSFIAPPYLTTARSESTYACLDIVGVSEATVLTSTNLNISLNSISGAAMTSLNSGKSYTITGTLTQVQAALSTLKINSSSGRIMAANSGSIYLRVRANLIADATTDTQCLDIGNDGRISLYQFTSDQTRRKNVPQKSGSTP